MVNYDRKYHIFSEKELENYSHENIHRLKPEFTLLLIELNHLEKKRRKKLEEKITE